MSQESSEASCRSPTPASGRGRAGLCAAAQLTAIATLVSLLAGFAGRALWLLELQSHFRVQQGAVLVVAGLVLLTLRRWWRAGAALAIGLLLLVPEVVPHAGATAPDPDPGDSLRLVSLNLSHNNRQRILARDWLDAVDADLVLLLEFDHDWEQMLDGLGKRFPHRIAEVQEGSFGLALYSRLPLGDARIEWPEHPGATAVARAKLELGGAALTFLGAHPLPPISAEWSSARDQQIVWLAQQAASAGDRVVIAGDLNCTPWSPRFSPLEDTGGLRRAGSGRGWKPTWMAGFPPLAIPIDHILTGPALSSTALEVGPALGSDHRPLSATIALSR